MFTIALIGGDGAGKSKIAKMLVERFPGKLKYLYMGVNINSSNVVLPTTYIRDSLRNGDSGNDTLPANREKENSRNKTVQKNPVWRFARLLNRLAEEWYRQFLARNYCKHDYIVLYDRHFLFDYARCPLESDEEYKKRPWDDRLHRWLLQRFYPQPDIVLFLHAPAEVLFARKGELSVEKLDRLQQTYREQGKKTKNFFIMDSQKPLEALYDDVNQKIMQFYRLKNTKNNEAFTSKEIV